MLAYLDEIGGADVGPTDLPLEIDEQLYQARYAIGGSETDHFAVAKNERFDKLTIQRNDGTARTLFHQGGHVFHPAGAPSARIHFVVEEGAVPALEIRNPDLVVVARRVR